MLLVIFCVILFSLIPLGLTAVASATDAAIQRNVLGSDMTTLIILNKEIDDIIKIIKSREEAGLVIKGISETTKHEVKEQKKWISWHIIRQRELLILSHPCLEIQKC